MSEFINNMLGESEENMNDDPFFRPKDMKKREKEEERKRKEILSKIQSGLQNIKISYENKNWDSKKEKLFLQIFSKFHSDGIYNEKYDEYSLQDKNNKINCVFNLKNEIFWISYGNWLFFEKMFDRGYIEIQSFMKQMLNNYFKLYDLTPKFFVNEYL